MKINRFIAAVLLLVGCSLTSALPAAGEKAARPSRACKNSDGSLKCSYCDKRFAEHGNLKQHERDHKALCLLELGQELVENMPVNMSAPKKRSAVDKSHYREVCQECGTKWCSVAALNVHMRSHNGFKPYQCRYCPSRFSVNMTWKRHELRHSGAQPFPCDFCENKFTRKDSMLAHRLLHTGEKPYSCEYEGCNAVFRIRHELREHWLTYKHLPADAIPIQRRDRKRFKTGIVGAVDLADEEVTEAAQNAVVASGVVASVDLAAGSVVASSTGLSVGDIPADCVVDFHAEDDGFSASESMINNYCRNLFSQELNSYDDELFLDLQTRQ